MKVNLFSWECPWVRVRERIKHEANLHLYPASGGKPCHYRP